MSRESGEGEFRFVILARRNEVCDLCVCVFLCRKKNEGSLTAGVFSLLRFLIKLEFETARPVLTCLRDEVYQEVLICQWRDVSFSHGLTVQRGSGRYFPLNNEQVRQVC